jgi:hypothetical protein
MTNQGGRPSLYDESFCDIARKLGADGKLPAQIARTIGVCKETLHEWARVHPKFSDALKDAKTASEGWMLDVSQDSASGSNPQANPAMIKFLLSAAHGYREKSDQSIEIEGNIHKAKEPISFKSMMIPKD